MPSGVSAQASVLFERVSSPMDRISVLSLSVTFFDAYKTFPRSDVTKIEFRNVPIER